jgi:lysophospholipase L1-like esterase
MRLASSLTAVVLLLAACTAASGDPGPSTTPATAGASPAGAAAPAPAGRALPCPRPHVPGAAVETFRDPTGACLPGRELVRYRCSPLSQPTLVTGMTTKQPVDYLGGSFATEVGGLPGDARLFAASEDGTLVYRSPSQAGVLFVFDRGSLERWPRIRRFTTSSGAVVKGMYPPDVFFLGDSVMLGAESAILDAFGRWEVTFDAQVSRSTVGGLVVLKARLDEIKDMVVIQMGTNDGTALGPYAQHVDEIMRLLKDVPLVVWLTIREARDYYADTNATLRTTVAKYPNAQVADWNAAAPADGMYGDGLHLRPEGGVAMAALVHDAVAGWYASTFDRGPNGCRASLSAALRPAPIPARLEDELR